LAAAAGEVEDGVTAKTIATRKRQFLENLSAGVTVCEAADAVKVSRATMYRWRQEDEQFALAWADVEEAGTQKLEAEAVRRAIEGKSDVLLIFLLKARRPEVYRENVRFGVSAKEGVDGLELKLSFDPDSNGRPALVRSAPETT
jgi:hypothetical protein